MSVPGRIFVEIGPEEMSVLMVFVDHQMEFKIFCHAVTSRLPVRRACFASNTSIPLLLATTFLKDPTEPEEQRCFL